MQKRALTFIALGLFMAALPVFPEPHLWQKWKLFVNGWLHKPEDWFDFAFHGLPLVLALAYYAIATVVGRIGRRVASQH